VEPIQGSIAVVSINAMGNRVGVLTTHATTTRATLYTVAKPDKNNNHYELEQVGRPLDLQLLPEDLKDGSFVFAPIDIPEPQAGEPSVSGQLIVGTSAREYVLYDVDEVTPKRLTPTVLGTGPVVAGAVQGSKIVLFGKDEPANADARTSQALQLLALEDGFGMLCGVAATTDSIKVLTFHNHPIQKWPKPREEKDVMVTLGYLWDGSLKRREWQSVDDIEDFEQAKEARAPLLSVHSKSFWRSCDRITTDSRGNLGETRIKALSKLSIARLGWFIPEAGPIECPTAPFWVMARGTWRHIAEREEGACVRP
jgi:hypothetical protein